MNDRRMILSRLSTRIAVGRKLDKPIRAGESVRVLSSEILVSERAALFMELRPFLRRLDRIQTEIHPLEPIPSNPVYAKYCEILDAYDPSQGCPLRPYLLRNLTAMYQDGPGTLKSAITALPAAERDAISLRYYYGRMVGEIAERLSIGAGAASALIDSGLCRLREVFGQEP